MPEIGDGRTQFGAFRVGQRIARFLPRFVGQETIHQPVQGFLFNGKALVTPSVHWFHLDCRFLGYSSGPQPSPWRAARPST
ncbi:hypothetical protein, partial [Streptomyces coelicoflavus]|uniref:hypothetical protein n=1 Tax=Streptomyces coelicoflavus TaxID=285562 RepID=UPI003629CBD2